MRRESGDTLVEVLIAITILGAAAVAGLGIMNFGFGAILNSIERTQVQASINSQLSLLQYARDAYVQAGRPATPAEGGAKIWQDIMLNMTTANYSKDVCKSDASPNTNTGRKPFYIKENGTDQVPLTTFPAANGVPTLGNGLWVEAVRPSASTNYIDFYVKACWQPVAGSTNQESRSVMRLYTGDTVHITTTSPVIPGICTVLEATNHIVNGTFAVSAGNGPGVDPVAGFTSDLPNRGSDVYPDDAGLNGTTKIYTGGFSLQHGEKWYGTAMFPNALHGRPFPGDPTWGVPAANTWFYSNPNQRADQPPGTDTTFSGILWRQTLTVQPNSKYDFSGYFDNLMVTQSQGVNPRIQLRANGVPLMAPIEIGVTPDSYQRVTLVFETGASQNSVTLDIFDYANNIQGDDFAMTGLALRKCV